jgi:hypothetical protein
MPASAVFIAITASGIALFAADGTIPVAEAEHVSEVSDAAQERCIWERDRDVFSVLQNDGTLILRNESECQSSSVSSADDDRSDAVDGTMSRMIGELAQGYPIEAMAPDISRYDRGVAALIVGIAKKESDWGKHSPRAADGSDCYNYWGWKGAGTRGMAMGHGCFGTPEEAVKAVGDRLTQLVQQHQTSEPSGLTVWKCGSSCATHSRESVLKWISDVDFYYRKIAKS